MPTLSTNLRTQLSAAQTKTAWSNLLKSLLGSNIRIRCFRSSDANSTDPSVDGVEFLNVGSDGDFKFLAGEIVSFGSLSGATIKAQANLATGKSVIRMEGNGYWISFSLGLAGSGKEFMLASSPSGSASEGIAFFSSASLRPPRLHPSGTGPFAPAIRSVTPTIVELVDWSNPAAPVVVGTGTFSDRVDDWVFQQTDLAAEMGDIAIYQLNNPIQWASAGFELGGILFLGNSFNTVDGTTPLEQSLCGFKPIGRWKTYPAMDTYARSDWLQTGVDAKGDPTYTCQNPTTYDTTFPPPCKINLKRADGTIVFTHEVKAFNGKPALPLNSPLLSQRWTEKEPLIPHLNCGQLLPWQNIQTRLSSRYKKFFPGVSARSYAPKNAKSSFTSNPGFALYSSAQMNGLNHMYGMPPYPMRMDFDYGDLADDVIAYDPGPRDVNLFNKGQYGDFGGKTQRMTGWKYQPGSCSGHDWFMAKGGQRFDRSVVPSLLAIYAAKQDFVRPDGNVPIRDMLDSFSFAYFNHPCHWLRDAKTFETVPKIEIERGQWVFAGAFYGSGPYGPQGGFRGPQTTVDMVGVGNGDNRRTVHEDASGRMPWSGWLRDNLHSHHHSAWMAIMLNSPMHAYSNIFHYNAHWMSCLSAADSQANTVGKFLGRDMAWRWLAYTMQWTVGTKHSMGTTQESIERRFEDELNKYYTDIYLPTHVQNSQNIYFLGIRNLGVAVSQNKNHLDSMGGAMGLYMTHVFVTMKQMGLWKRMCERSFKAKAVLEMVMTAFDKQTIDYILDTDGRDCYYQRVAPDKPEGYVFTAADIPANWVQQKAMLDIWLPVLAPDFAGNTDGFHDDRKYKNWGTYFNGTPQDQTSVQHLQYQWVKARKFFFPEYPHARLDAAIAKYDGYYAAAAAHADGGAGGEWRFRLPSHGDILAPSELGPV